MKNELWLPAVGYEGFYEVSNMGNVRAIARKVPHSKNGYTRLSYGRLLTPIPNKRADGYLYVSLHASGFKKVNKSVHRLVSEAWIKNPFDLKEVNHKDFDRQNNCIENLEWISPTGNRDHFNKSGRRVSQAGKYGKRIAAFDRDGNKIGEYVSVREAGRQLGCFGQNINAVLKGRNRWCKHKTFQYID